MTPEQLERVAGDGERHLPPLDPESVNPGFAGRLIRVAPGGVPLRSGSIDVALLLQTIEHVADDVGLLRELGRVLSRDGRVFITTPNVAFSGGDPDRPLNPFHLREYDTARLTRVCRAAFTDVEPLYLHGSLRSGGGGFGPERSSAFRAMRKLLRLCVPARLYEPPISLADFRVANGGDARALDLLFVCRGPV